jgi:hypothetical protein
MVGKIARNSTGFGGLVNYLEREMKHAKIIASEGVCIVDKAAIVDSFQMQANGARISNPVGHIALSWHPADTPRMTDELMAQVAREYMDMMHIQDTQFIIARHFDTQHPHCHLLYNRVDNQGRTISDSNIRRRNVEACKVLNRKYGFKVGQQAGVKNLHEEKLRGKAQAIHQMRKLVFAARVQSFSWEEFRSHLEQVGIRLMFRYGKDAGIKGVIFADDQRSFGGGTLHPLLTLQALDRRFGGELAAQNYGARTPSPASNQQHDEDKEDKTKGLSAPKLGHLPEAIPTLSLPQFPDDTTSDSPEDESMPAWLAIPFEVAKEMILQPHVVMTPNVGGGGTRQDDDWGDRDKDKYDNKYRPFKRRR